MKGSRKSIPPLTDTRSVGLLVFRLLMRMAAAVDRWQARRQAMRQYFGVSRHTLFDIGFTEADAAGMVYGRCKLAPRAPAG